VPEQTPASRNFVQAPPSIDAVLAGLAARQHGVARVTDLLDARLSKSAISRRVARGNLHRLYHGVYAIGHTALSEEGEWMAAALAGGEGAALAGLAAARLWQAWRYKIERIDVLTRRQMRPVGRTVFHWARTIHPRDVTTYRGIPVTTMARTLVDLTDCLTKWELASVIHEAAFRERYHPRAAKDAIGRANGRRNVDKLEQAVELHESGSAGVRSRGELKPDRQRARRQPRAAREHAPQRVRGRLPLAGPRARHRARRPRPRKSENPTR
jgi:hypothetical protein